MAQAGEPSSRLGGSEIAPGLFYCFGPPLDQIAPDAVIAVSLVRDEAWRLPFWLAYHRWLGVDHFVMIDNSSVDHTCDLLREQPDVTLISAPGRYEWAAWANAVIRLCPPAGWSLALDADELFIAPPWRQGGLRETIRALEAEDAEAAFALMVDCHAETLHPPATEDIPTTPWRRAPWFDAGPYAKWMSSKRFPRLFYAGARERLAWPRWKLWPYTPGPLRKLTRMIGHPLGVVDPPCIVKVPLHRSRSRGASIHDAGTRHHRSANYFNLLHYKIDIDLPQKVQCALAERQHWRGSVEYMAYAKMLQEPPRVLLTAESRRFTGLSSLVDAQVCRHDPDLVKRVGDGGPIDSALEQVESELSRFGDRHLAPTISLAALT